MAIQWSGLGPELLLRLDRGSGQPLRSQLEAGLREAIRSGRLNGGERLPSSRELARELGVSRGLVQECYSQLLAEGYLNSQIGSATRVAAGGYPAPPARAPGAAPAPRLIADFRAGVPDLASFPRGDWVWATREACSRVAAPDLDYGDPRGSAVLRHVLAGVVLAARRRHALVDWARRHSAFIVEDDYDSEFRYDKEPVGVMQGLAPDRVFTIGTASKALAPAVRLGWVLSPASLAGAVAAEKEMSDRGTSTLDQLVLAALLESGRYDRHLRRMRTIYASRRATLIAALAQHAPGIRLTGLAAGFHAVAHLPASADEQAVAAAARERQVGLYPMGSYRATGSTAPPQLVMGFGQVSERAVEPGITAVADLLR